MKRLIFPACLALGLASGAWAAQLNGYTNNGFFSSSSPTLVIDATNFVNNGTFALAISGFDAGQFDFSDVRTYTNRGVMYCDQGFLFNNSPSSTGQIQPSANFLNQNPGQIYAGALILPVNSLISGASGPAPQIIISATNITSSGVMQVGQAGRISVTGNNVNLGHGSALVESFEQDSDPRITGGSVLGPGEIIQYWGAGMQSNTFFFPDLNPANATAPSSRIVDNGHNPGFAGFNLLGANAIAITNIINPSNIYTQVVLWLDNEGIATENAFFLPPVSTFVSTNNFGEAVVEWSVVVTNAFGQVLTNTLFLTDNIGSLPTNVTFVTNNTTLGGLTQLVPTNYTLLASFPDVRQLTNMGNVPYKNSLFTNGFGTNGNGVGSISNEYATFEVVLAPVTVEPDLNVAGSAPSNVPARVEITANQTLDMTGAIIDAGNYLNLTSPNDYRGSQGAQITFPFADINLGSSNGQMVISNLVPPYLARWSGQIQAWSTVWTNLTSATQIVMNGTNAPTTNTFTVTNAFMVTMVLSDLFPTAPVNIDSLALRSTNLVISDSVTVNNNLLLNTQNLTITSNAANDFTPDGELIFLPSIAFDFYSVFVPAMQNFTNFGVFETENAAYLQFRQDPNTPSVGDGPWQSVVNHGVIASGGGTIIWANDFENTGPAVPNPLVPSGIEAESGPIFVQSSTALITNSAILTLQGDMSLTSGNLTIANAQLQATGFLDLAATNLITDLVSSGTGAVTSPNAWSSGDGFSLLTAPTSPSGLLGTTITSACRTNAVCDNTWAGLSNNLSGGPGSVLPTLANNVPIGKLVLDGGNTNSVFHFQGPDQVNPYAMYVDQIQLQDGATNFAGGKYTAFNVDPNMTIFFLNAKIGATDISTVLNGQAAAGGGHLVWLNNYVSHFSVAQVTYADGETFAVNSAYVQAYGLPPEPQVVLTPQTIMLKIGSTNVNSSPMATISWYSPAHSTNTLYYKSLTGGSWQVRTNFVSGGTSGRVSVLDSLGSSHLYKVNVAQ